MDLRLHGVLDRQFSYSTVVSHLFSIFKNVDNKDVDVNIINRTSDSEKNLYKI